MFGKMSYGLGLVLFCMGVPLALFKEDITKYRNVLGFRIPYKETVYPFRGLAILLILIALFLILVTMYREWKNVGRGKNE